MYRMIHWIHSQNSKEKIFNEQKIKRKEATVKEGKFPGQWEPSLEVHSETTA